MITELRGGTAVERFHTTGRLSRETVGHHSCNVALLLLRLDPNCSRELLVAALTHDLAEVATGDVPATAKWDNPGLAKELKYSEAQWELDHDVPGARDFLSDKEIQLLKVADMADLVMSCVEESKRGNQYAVALVNNGMNWLQKCELLINDESLNKRLGAMIMEVQRGSE